MTHCNGESNGERSWSADPRPERVTGSEDRHHEDEGDEELNTEHLSQWHSATRSRSTHHVYVGRCVCERLEKRSSDDCTHRLHHDVQKGSVLNKPTALKKDHRVDSRTQSAGQCDFRFDLFFSFSFVLVFVNEFIFSFSIIFVFVFFNENHTATGFTVAAIDVKL